MGLCVPPYYIVGGVNFKHFYFIVAGENVIVQVLLFHSLSILKIEVLDRGLKCNF